MKQSRFAGCAWVILLVACEGRLSAPGAPIEAGSSAPRSEPGGPVIERLTCAAPSVEVNRPLECEAKAAHPKGLPLRCALQTSPAATPVPLGDCKTTAQAAVTLDKVGMVTITLTVFDPDGRQASQSVSVEVTAKPNQPPTIASLTAAPKNGPVPLNSVISFSATDPDNDMLSCSLDVGADGTVEFAGLGCSAQTQAVEVKQIGVLPVKLSVKDDKGLSVEQTIELEGRSSVGDLKLATIDFGQTVISAKPRLVEGKTALLRVFALATQANVKADVEVEAKQGGTSLGVKSMEAPATVPLTESLNQLAGAYRLMLPVEWVVPGVSLTLRVDPKDALLESDETNNSRVIDLDVGRGNVLHLTTFPVIQGGLTGKVFDPTAEILKFWPVKTVEIKTRAAVTLNTPLSNNGDSWGQGLDQVQAIRRMDGSKRNYLGLVGLKPGNGGFIAGIGVIGQGASLAIDFDSDTSVHELGHNFGLDHAPCGGVAGADRNYPDPNGKIVSTGFDGVKLVDPTKYVDIMSYCNPVWVSEYNYKKVQAFMEASSAFGPSALMHGAPEARPSLALSGRIAADGAVLNPLTQISAVPSAGVASDTEVVLTLADGTQTRVPVTLETVPETKSQHFSTVIAWPGQVAKAELRHGREVLVERAATAFTMAPKAVAERISPSAVRVRWSGGLYATVAHLRSPQQMLEAEVFDIEGLRRTTLTVSAMGGEAVLNAERLGAGELEVSVSDGVQSAVVYVPMP